MKNLEVGRGQKISLQKFYDDWWMFDHAIAENTKMKLVNSSKIRCNGLLNCR
jgi:hypothetical protein